MFYIMCTLSAQLCVLFRSPSWLWGLLLAWGSAEPEEVVHVHPHLSHTAPFWSAWGQCGSALFCQLPLLTDESTKDDTKHGESHIRILQLFVLTDTKTFTEAWSRISSFFFTCNSQKFTKTAFCLHKASSLFTKCIFSELLCCMLYKSTT